MKNEHEQSDKESLNPWEDLILSILAVNNYSLEKVYALAGSFRREGLLDIRNLGKWEEADIAVRLGKAGYDRGLFMTDLFSKRLAALGRFAASRGLSDCERVLYSKDPSSIQQLFQNTKGIGIGPTVLTNLAILSK
jgi:hypothetical protein